MSCPKVSVIIPNYNHKTYLKQRLETVFEQTFQDFEVILLDDASTDNSVAILKQYANHPKVSHFIINEKNSGSPFKQWKKGIDLAKGEYIWIAESDDYAASNFLNSLIESFKNDVVLAYCASNIIDEKGNVLGLNKWATALDGQRWHKNYFNKGKNEIKNFLKFRNTIPNASAVIFKKENIEEVEIPNNMNFCGDWYLWVELLKKGDVTYLAKPLNFFRRHKHSTRVIKDIEKERKRFNEYFDLISQNSFLLDRIRNLKKYDWILVERDYKTPLFSEADKKIKLPLELRLRNWLRNKKFK